MKYNIWLVITATLLVSPITASAQCLASEDFDDGVTDAIWSVAQFGNQQVAEQNGRLEFPGSAATGDDMSIAGYVGAGWQIDLSEQFLLSGVGGITLPNPGDDGICGLVTMFTATSDDPLNGDLDTAIVYFHGWAWGELVEGFDVWSNGEKIYEEYEPASSGESTDYIGYDPVGDVLYIDDTSKFTDPWAIEGFADLLGDQVSLSLFAIRAGTYDSNTGSQLWTDNWCMHDGQLIGPAVGACCIGDACVETLESSCDGVWIGSATHCDDFTCELSPEGACCVGTSCQQLTADDCFAAGGSYHGHDVSCDTTPCGGGAGCPADWSEDCAGICFPIYIIDAWVGDGYCDVGTYAPTEGQCPECPPGEVLTLDCFDCDGGDCPVVNASDLDVLLNAWGPCEGCPSDLDYNGTVDVSDLLVLLDNWGTCQ